jgi:hypothetical protein
VRATTFFEVGRVVHSVPISEPGRPGCAGGGADGVGVVGSLAGFGVGDAPGLEDGVAGGLDGARTEGVGDGTGERPERRDGASAAHAAVARISRRVRTMARFISVAFPIRFP